MTRQVLPTLILAPDLPSQRPLAAGTNTYLEIDAATDAESP